MITSFGYINVVPQTRFCILNCNLGSSVKLALGGYLPSSVSSLPKLAFTKRFKLNISHFLMPLSMKKMSCYCVLREQHTKNLLRHSVLDRKLSFQWLCAIDRHSVLALMLALAVNLIAFTAPNSESYFTRWVARPDLHSKMKQLRTLAFIGPCRQECFVVLLMFFVGKVL